MADRPNVPRARIERSFVFVLILGLFLVGCEKRERDLITIGAALPLTGEGAPYGEGVKKAIDLAVEEINSAGGVKSYNINVIYEDTKMLPREAANAVNKLITTDKVLAILGPFTSSEVHAVLPILNQQKVVAISPSATDSKLSIINDYFFRTMVSDAHEGLVMAEFAFNKMKYRTMGILYIESSGPVGVSETFRKKFVELGGAVPVVERGSPNSTDFRAQLSRIKAKDVDAIFIAALALETGTMLKQAKELAIHKQILAHQPVEDPEVREIAGNAADGVIFASSKLDSATGDEATKNLYEKFRAKYGEDPRSYAANAYDAVYLLTKAIKKYGPTPEGITKGLYEVKDYSGTSGTLTFDQSGDIVLPLRTMIIENSQIKPYHK